MDSSNIPKIWGIRNRIVLSNTSEIDHVILKKNTFCSLHNHKKKINFFYVLKGKVKIDSEYGTQILKKGQSFEIRPPLKHRFTALVNSEMIEIAYVEKGIINENDIYRYSLGGRIIDGKYLSIPELKKANKLDL